MLMSVIENRSEFAEKSHVQDVYISRSLGDMLKVLENKIDELQKDMLALKADLKNLRDEKDTIIKALKWWVTGSFAVVGGILGVVGFLIEHGSKLLGH
jgi:molecular chaperone GrpE (heat shock protein)